MGHCRGGPGPDTWDRLAPLVEWVENGTAPESVAATHQTNGVVDNERILCPYPEQARYESYYGLCLAQSPGSLHDALKHCRKAVKLEGYRAACPVPASFLYLRVVRGGSAAVGDRVRLVGDGILEAQV